MLLFQTSYAIQLQLLGGIWICQTLPAVLIALYTRFFHPYALLTGWATGILSGTVMVAQLGFKSSTYPLHIMGVTIPCYAAVTALVLNIAGACAERDLQRGIARSGRNGGEDYRV